MYEIKGHKVFCVCILAVLQTKDKKFLTLLGYDTIALVFPSLLLIIIYY